MPVPGELAAGSCGGSFDGDWHTEEHRGACRLGFRVAGVLHDEVSPLQRIRVYDTPFFGRVLTLDDLVMLTERDEFVYHEMLVHVPLLSLESPRSLLVVGGGDCGCIREALRHPTLERIVQCEIDERVTRVCEEWFPWVAETIADPRVELVFADAVELIAGSAEAFDVVVIDSTDPVGPAAALFRQAFYRQVARSLRRGGVMSAQTESPHWDAPLVGAIYRELRGAFRQVHAYLGNIPSYPSGGWSWAWASNDRAPDGFFDEGRAAAIAETCRYYNPALQRAAFALPNHARRAVDGEDPFAYLGGAQE
ncbi:MAG: polyamine aminopropyltransferase [Planctomycetota bacterium]